MELRNRFNNNSNDDHVRNKENVKDESDDKKYSNKSNTFLKNILYVLFLTIGFVICFMISKYYSNYLKKSHENTLWFSKIKV
jgi:hypothetical protein